MSDRQQLFSSHPRRHVHHVWRVGVPWLLIVALRLSQPLPTRSPFVLRGEGVQEGDHVDSFVSVEVEEVGEVMMTMVMSRMMMRAEEMRTT